MACLTPYMVTAKHSKSLVPVPCGKCPGCRNARASQWSFRLMQEEKQSESAHFITLTYDTSRVPITKNGFMDIRRRDLQLFFKRLRKSISSDNKKAGIKSRAGTGRPIRYYAVGEYGGKGNRPHYHLIIFNVELKHIQPAWNNGAVHYGQVTGASIGYCMKYITKPNKVPKHRNDDRTPEFALMSKGWG